MRVCFVYPLFDYLGDIPRPKPLCCLEVDKKFVVGGGVDVVDDVCKPVFSIGFDQGEQ